MNVKQGSRVSEPLMNDSEFDNSNMNSAIPIIDPINVKELVFKQ